MRVSLELIDLFKSPELRQAFNADALDAGVNFRLAVLSDSVLEAFDRDQSQGLFCPVGLAP